jgi:hypothetical protein
MLLTYEQYFMSIIVLVNLTLIYNIHNYLIIYLFFLKKIAPQNGVRFHFFMKTKYQYKEPTNGL